jgi:hypothetical protein
MALKFARLSAAFAVLVVLGGSAMAAGANPTPAPPPDPKWQNATPYVLSLKVFDQCLIQQSRLQNTTREAVHTPCSCYAKATIAQMSKPELDFLRGHGYFDDTSREKALTNIDKCKLKRP